MITLLHQPKLSLGYFEIPPEVTCNFLLLSHHSEDLIPSLYPCIFRRRSVLDLSSDDKEKYDDFLLLLFLYIVESVLRISFRTKVLWNLHNLVASAHDSHRFMSRLSDSFAQLAPSCVFCHRLDNIDEQSKREENQIPPSG